MKTRHISFIRGSTYSFTETVRDRITNQPVDLTDAKIYLDCRADLKIATTSFRLCSENPAPSGSHRIGIEILDQDNYPGQYRVTFAPVDTTSLEARGHDDPWLYDVRILMDDGSVIQDIGMSNLDLYPQVTNLPA